MPCGCYRESVWIYLVRAREEMSSAVGKGTRRLALQELERRCALQELERVSGYTLQELERR